LLPFRPERLERRKGTLVQPVGATSAGQVDALTLLASGLRLLAHAVPGRNMMRRGSAGVLLLAVTAALLAAGFRGSAPAAGPGAKIGAMTLVRGNEHEADDELWGRYCASSTPKPGRYSRTCTVPRVQRLFIGYGDLEPTMSASVSAWKKLKWKLWLDGRPVDLPPFGTDVRTLVTVQIGGKNAVLREWSVILTGATPGKHVIRYRNTSPAGVTDATWTFTVQR
jgi:hypothetical protein